jgi:O-antigen/teichoic acid export membrane protein
MIRKQPLARDSAAVFAALVAGAATSFAVQVLLARLAGPEQFGAYSLVLSWTMILATLAEFGFGPTVLRFVAEYAAIGDYQHLRGVLRCGTQIAGGVGLIAAIGVVLGSHYLSRSYATPFLFGAPLVPLLAILRLHTTTLMGLRRPVAAVVVAQWLRHIVFITLILVVSYAFWVVINAALAVALSGVALLSATAVCYCLVVSILPASTSQSKPSYRTNQWLAVAFPLWLVSLAEWALARSDLLIIGVFRPEAEVGFYSAAIAMAGSADLLMAAVRSVVAPDFAKLHARGGTAELQRTVTKATRMTFAAVLPFALFLIVFAKPILLLFGKSFSSGRSALSLLALAQVVNGFTGPVGLVLSQAGGHSAFAKVIAASTAVSVGLELLLVPRYGIVGGATATFLSVLIRSGALSLVVLYKIGVMPTALGSRAARLADVSYPAAQGTR